MPRRSVSRWTSVHRVSARGGGEWRILEVVAEKSVYRTELGKVFRISEHDDGGLSVELLELTQWVPGPIGMAGLRIARTTTRLTARQILALPQ